MTPRSRTTALPADAWLSAADAAARLGVSRATLYAYVSRGFLRSESHPGASRERRYARDDVERLRRRAEERRDPDKVAAHALQWGMPILESSITSIAGARVFYRGHDAVALARSRSFEEVASLIWTGRFDELSPAPLRAPGLAPAARRLPFVARAQATLATVAPRDALAVDLRADAVVRTGMRILDLLTQTATRRVSSADTIDRRLARAWRVGRDGADVLRAALVLCADHELNVSSFTARCVASAGSNP
jgi:citrate synthase